MLVVKKTLDNACLHNFLLLSDSICNLITAYTLWFSSVFISFYPILDNSELSSLSKKIVANSMAKLSNANVGFKRFPFSHMYLPEKKKKKNMGMYCFLVCPFVRVIAYLPVILTLYQTTRVPRGPVVKWLTRNPGVLGSHRTGSSGFFT